MANHSKNEMLGSLRILLDDVLKMRHDGAASAKLSRAHGYVDGFMRALLDAGIAERQELLELVALQRQSLDGPATRIVEPEALDSRVDANAA